MPILDRNKIALLVIDIQDKLLPAMMEQQRLLKNTKVLLSMAEEYQLPTFYSEQYPKGLGLTNASIKEQLDTLHAFHLEKTAYSALLPPLEEALKKSERSQIILCGMETHICVFQTARALREAGYEVLLPVDALSSRTELNWRMGLRQLEQHGCWLSTTESILFDVIKDAKDPSFKTLQALIK